MIHYRAIIITPITDGDTTIFEQQLNDLAEQGYRLVHAQGLLYVMEKLETPSVQLTATKLVAPQSPKKPTPKRKNVALAQKNKTSRA